MSGTRLASAADNAPPTTTNVSVVPNPSNGSPLPTISATITDAAMGGGKVAAAEFFIDPVGTPANGTGTVMASQDGNFDEGSELVGAILSASAFAGLTEGTHTVSVRGKDDSNNWGALASTTFVKDTVAPVSTISFPTATTYVESSWNAGCSTPTGDICGTSTDGSGSGVQNVLYSMRRLINNGGVESALFWDGTAFASANELFHSASGSTSWSASFGFGNFPADGEYVMRARARDNAQNIETSPTVQFTVDTAAPTVTSIDRVGNSPTNASSVDWLVTFSENVSGVDATDFDLVEGGGLSGATVTGVSGSNNTRTVTANTGSGNGTLGLNLVDDDSITDGVGNPLGGAGAGNGNFVGQVFTIDKTAPSSTIDFPGTGPYGLSSWNAGCETASTGDMCGTSSENETGVARVEVSIRQGSGNYWNGSSFSSPTEFFLTASLFTNGFAHWNLPFAFSNFPASGSYTVHARGIDAAENVESSPMVTFTIDVTAPSILSMTRNDADPTNAASVSWTATFSEDVTGVDATDFNLQASPSLSGTSITSVTPVSGSIYTVTANTGTGSGMLRLRLGDNDSIQDGAGNPLDPPGTGTNIAGEFYTIDRIAPTSTITFPTATSYGSSTWAAGCATAGVDDTCGTASDTGGSLLNRVEVSLKRVSNNLFWDGSGFGSATEVFFSANGTTSWNFPFDFTNFPANGSYTMHTRAVDNATNVETSPFVTFSVDVTPPTVVSINRASGNPTAASSVDWTVTFSESVTGVDTSDFTLQKTGTIAGESITSIVPAGPSGVYTLTANTGTGSGNLRPRLNDDDSIKDVAGNPLAGAADGSFTGQAYTIDRTPPSVVSINRADPNPTNAASVSWTVTFSESVTGVDTSDFVLVPTGLGGSPAITGVSGSGSTRTVTASTGTGSGTLGLNLVDDNSIEDSVGNDLGGPAAGDGDATGQVYDIDRTAPTSTITFPTATSYNATTWNAGCSTPDGDACGTASDTGGAGVNREEVSVRNNSSGLYWNGSAFSSAGEFFVSAVGTTSWNFPFAFANFPADGSYTMHARAVDNATNVEASPIVTFTIDTTPPFVVSINRANPSPTNAASVSWTVTFSEPVNGVDATDFQLVKTGAIAGESITSVTPAGPASVYTVTANTGTGSGTLGLNLVDDDSIADIATNPLGTSTGAGDGSFTGQVYVIDKDAPTSTITFPVQGGIYNDTLWNAGCSTPAGDACGTVSDTGGSGVNREEVSVRRVSTGLYWNGSSFSSATELFFPATGTSNWTFAFAAANFPATGEYTLHARGVDNATNVETPGPSVTFIFGVCQAGSRSLPIFVGTSGNDTLCGDGSNQSFQAGAGNDLIFANGGKDTVNGGDGDDIILGGPGNDSLNGQNGNDRIFGEAGNDGLFGGAGFDELDGGTETDSCFTESGGGTRTNCEAGA